MKNDELNTEGLPPELAKALREAFMQHGHDDIFKSALAAGHPGGTAESLLGIILEDDASLSHILARCVGVVAICSKDEVDMTIEDFKQAIDDVTPSPEITPVMLYTLNTVKAWVKLTIDFLANDPETLKRIKEAETAVEKKIEGLDTDMN
jgi:hypothetical protein